MADSFDCCVFPRTSGEGRGASEVVWRALGGTIRQTVAGIFAVPTAALTAPTRGRARIAFARQVAMYLAHVGWGITLTEVGRLFGRDRTTVAHACRIIEDRRDDAGLDLVLSLLEAAIRSHIRATPERMETK